MNISTNLKEKALRTSRALAIVMGLVASSQAMSFGPIVTVQEFWRCSARLLDSQGCGPEASRRDRSSGEAGRIETLWRDLKRSLQ
jgi:hypothetical protein